MNLLQIIVNITITVNNNNCLHIYLLCDRFCSKHFVNILLILTIPSGVGGYYCYHYFADQEPKVYHVNVQIEKDTIYIAHCRYW